MGGGVLGIAYKNHLLSNQVPADLVTLLLTFSVFAHLHNWFCIYIFSCQGMRGTQQQRLSQQPWGGAQFWAGIQDLGVHLSPFCWRTLHRKRPVWDLLSFSAPTPDRFRQPWIGAPEESARFHLDRALGSGWHPGLAPLHTYDQKRLLSSLEGIPSACKCTRSEKLSQTSEVWGCVRKQRSLIGKKG